MYNTNTELQHVATHAYGVTLNPPSPPPPLSLPHCPQARNIGNKGASLFLVVQFVVTSYYAFLEGARNSEVIH
jgi:hypothetical protein